MTNNIKKRETSKRLEHEGRTFILNAFNPLDGNYILLQLVSFIIPFGIGNMLKQSFSGSEAVNKIGSSGKIMSKEEFKQFQIDILSTVEEEYESGQKSPIVRENGTFGVTDVSSSLLIKLMVASIAFNFSDFFEESQLKEEFIGSLI